jgi:hypothetical protein
MREGEGVLQGNMGTFTLGSRVRLQEKGRPCHTLSWLQHAPLPAFFRYTHCKVKWALNQALFPRLAHLS